ncbi:MAG: hypothetical protein IT431_11160 [Phycisphaerales bacterium]|nr:hypothetical protein [Phycisphaerales bacterium]
MAPFERMIGGEWKLTVASGTSSFRTWFWGPGRHSMRVMTDGLDAAGNPWRDLDVFYWHPGLGQVREFGVSPFARGITDGEIVFEGETAQSDFDLYQTGGRRRLRLAWSFDGPDHYRATMLEASPPENHSLTFMAAWDFSRTEAPTPGRPFAVEGATEPSELLQPLKALLGVWGDTADGAGALRTHSTFEWIPLADAIYARVEAPGDDGEGVHLLDAYLYHHTGTGALRCLALSDQGVVYEGDLTVLEGGALRIDLDGYGGGRTVHLAVRLEFEQDGTLRHRVWSIEGAERTLVLDLHHARRHPEPAG